MDFISESIAAYASNLSSTIHYRKILSVHENFKTVVFSHETALFLADFISECPLSYDVTLFSVDEYSIPEINDVKIINGLAENFYLGIQTRKIYSTEVQYYDVERSLCDIVIRDNYSIINAMELFAIYFNYKHKNINKLKLYSDKLGIAEKLSYLFRW